MAGGRTGWLIHLDNADKDIFRYIPRIGGDVIFTTRDDVSTKAAVIPVDKMRHDDALLLLLGSKAIPHENSPEWENGRFACARKIVVELDYLPLAVDLSRAYVRHTRTSLKDYLTMLNKERDILFTYRDDSSELYNHTMATVWQLSFQRVRQQDPFAAQILEACAFLHPDAIPATFFENQSSILSLPGQGVDEHPKRVVRAAIAVLIEFSFLKQTRTECEDDDGDPSKDTLAIHRLVQMVLYDSMDSDHRLHWFQRLTTAFRNEINTSNYYDLQYRNVMNVNLPHIRHLIARLGPFDNIPIPMFTEDFDDFLRLVVRYLTKYYTLLGTEELADLSLSVAETVNGKDHGNTAASLNNLVGFYRLQRRYKKAEPLCERALSICERVLGLEHTETATLCTHLAEVFRNQRRYDLAEPLHQRALLIREKMLGPEHPDTAASLNNFAAFFHDQGNYDAAEPLYERALSICENVLGSDHSDTALYLRNLAIVYESQNRYDAAEPLYQRALSIREKVLGWEHPDTASSLNNLAELYTPGQVRRGRAALQAGAVDPREGIGSRPSAYSNCPQ